MTTLTEALNVLIKTQDEFILELQATIKKQDDMLDKAIATSDESIRIGEIACKALVWIVENPMAHSNNVRAVAMDALTKIKGE